VLELLDEHEEAGGEAMRCRVLLNRGQSLMRLGSTEKDSDPASSKKHYEKAERVLKECYGLGPPGAFQRPWRSPQSICSPWRLCMGAVGA
jgi:hypothetical protein